MDILNNAELNSSWENFQNSGVFDVEERKSVITKKHTPECSKIYISTKTKIAFLNTGINLSDMFWKIPVILYETPKEGVIKKQIKTSSINKEEVLILDEKIRNEKFIKCDIIKKIDNPNARTNKFKDIRKINIGINTKDLISYRKKKKGAFYNCFALIIRIHEDDKFKEIHVKVFNTGKLEIPGIQKNSTLTLVINKLIETMQPFLDTKLDYSRDIDTVLINSNFSCNFTINRNKLFDILKYKYNIHTLFDPCSYPGIQSKFYYNVNNKIQNGICQCTEKCNPKQKNCSIVSFMIFRTGSVLVVGHCDEKILDEIYEFLIALLVREYDNIGATPKELGDKKKKKKKKRKRIIIVSNKAIKKPDPTMDPILDSTTDPILDPTMDLPEN